MFNKIIVIGRLGQNAEAKTAQNNKEYVILSIATQESRKNDKGDYENRTEWHRVYAWRNLSKFAKTLQKGQLVTLEGILRYREVEDEVEAADDPSDGADDGQGRHLQAPDRRGPRHQHEAALESSFRSALVFNVQFHCNSL